MSLTVMICGRNDPAGSSSTFDVEPHHLDNLRSVSRKGTSSIMLPCSCTPFASAHFFQVRRFRPVQHATRLHLADDLEAVVVIT